MSFPRRILLWGLTSALLMPLRGTAQEAPLGPEERSLPPGPPVAPAAREVAWPGPPVPPPPPPLVRWLERLREHDPAEFERLQQLREADPEAFRRALAERIACARRKRGRPPFRPGWITTPEIERLERETRELARAFRGAGSQEERDRLAQELRDKLEKLFDLREQERARRIAEIEKHAAELRRVLQDRAQRREEIIARRFRQLTEAETTAW